tara:strand:+ start:1116 stop:1946 length:831 start_codon:yes stop_codon:yes gene_type:complete
MKNMENWNALSRVPEQHLKTIGFGALKGKSDINPQWRYKAMTEVYGQCGEGWSHRLVSAQIVDGASEEKLVFVEVAVTIAGGQEFTGMGGDKIVSKDKNGLRSNDEAFKMAYTDALGTALKYVGVASEIYEGNYDGSKYAASTPATPPPPPPIVSDEIESIWKQSLIDNDPLSMTALCAALTEDQEIYLNSSFESSKISAGKAQVKQLCSEGFKAWENLSSEVLDMIEKQDSEGLIEAALELKNHEKHHLKRLIGQEKAYVLGKLVSTVTQAIGGN